MHKLRVIVMAQFEHRLSLDIDLAKSAYLLGLRIDIKTSYIKRIVSVDSFRISVRHVFARK